MGLAEAYANWLGYLYLIVTSVISTVMNFFQDIQGCKFGRWALHSSLKIWMQYEHQISAHTNQPQPIAHLTMCLETCRVKIQSSIWDFIWLRKYIHTNMIHCHSLHNDFLVFSLGVLLNNLELDSQYSNCCVSIGQIPSLNDIAVVHRLRRVILFWWPAAGLN